MKYDINWLDDIGLDTKTGLSYTNGVDKYIAALQRYVKSYDKNNTNITSYYNSKDYDNFRITVHALKSNSLMIGATQLSKRFEALETAARDGDIAIIDSETASTLNEYSTLINKLSPIAAMEEVHTPDEISAEEAKNTAAKLLTALDDFDDELALALAQKLTGYPFRITQRDKLKEAISLIEDFVYDDAAEIIKNIAKTIE